MPVFVLSKVVGPRVNYLVRDTKKAVLLALMDNGEQLQYWFAKSQCTLRKRKAIGIVDGKPVELDRDILEVVIPDWLWKKREVARPMGCY